MLTKSKRRGRKMNRSKRRGRKMNRSKSRGGHMSGEARRSLNNAKRSLNLFISGYDTDHSHMAKASKNMSTPYNSLWNKNNSFRLIETMDGHRKTIELVMGDKYDPFEDIRQSEFINSRLDELNQNAIEYFTYKAGIREKQIKKAQEGSVSSRTNNQIKNRYNQESQNDDGYLRKYQAKLQSLANLKGHELGWKAIREGKQNPFNTINNLNSLDRFYKKNRKSANSYFTKIGDNKYKNNTVKKLKEFFDMAKIRIRSNKRGRINKNERNATPEIDPSSVRVVTL